MPLCFTTAGVALTFLCVTFLPSFLCIDRSPYNFLFVAGAVAGGAVAGDADTAAFV